jgi:protein PhnA
MSRGYDKHRQRQADVLGLGRHLARRSRSRCELCEASGVSLTPREVTPLPDEPDVDHALLICSECIQIVEDPKQVDGDLHFLEVAVWHEVSAVKVVANRILRALAARGAIRASQLIDEVYLTPEEAEWVEKDLA